MHWIKCYFTSCLNNDTGSHSVKFNWIIFAVTNVLHFHLVLVFKGHGLDATERKVISRRKTWQPQRRNIMRRWSELLSIYGSILFLPSRSWCYVPCWWWAWCVPCTQNRLALMFFWVFFFHLTTNRLQQLWKVNIVSAHNTSDTTSGWLCIHSVSG